MTSTALPSTASFRPKLWVPGDWNAFFGFGTNILVNLLTLSGLLLFVLQMPAPIVFNHILPAAGLMMFLSTMYYAFLAYRLAKKTGRTDVCALPSGISVPHMFIVTLVIMLPIKLAYAKAHPDAPVADAAMAGWQAGLVWVFIQSFVLMAGGFLAPIVRKITPKAALLGALAGVSITFISMAPVLKMYMTPMIGLVCFAIILASWFGGVKYGGVPAGLVAIAAGTIIAWLSTAFGHPMGGMSVAGLKSALSAFNFAVPTPSTPVSLIFHGLNWKLLSTILVTAIPFGIYDLVEAMDNVVSAAAAGDSYPTTRVLTADGIVSLIGCCMGNPYINAVYIGHPGWKAMGGRIGYSAATGIMVILLAWFGVISLMSAIIPEVAISPILLYIGMLIGAQAFQESPRKHAPAIILALIPSLAAWGLNLVNGALGAAGVDVTDDLVGKMVNHGVLFHGLAVVGGGSILAAVVLASIGVFVIERQFMKAACFAVAGAILSFFGLMHGEGIGWNKGGWVSVAYLIVAGVLYGCEFAAVPAPSPAEVESESAAEGEVHGEPA